MSLVRYYNTLKYLYPEQIYGRILHNIKRRSGLIIPAKADCNGSTVLPNKEPFPVHDPWNTSEDMEKGIFCFLNKTIDLGMPVDWEPEEASLLWKFNLHYFHYLRLLDRRFQIQLCRQWIGDHTSIRGTGWYPYPLSLRIVNWIKADIPDETIRSSIYSQASVLYRSVEYFYSGNHLLENARALIFAGLYFGNAGEAEKWLKTGLKIYREELPSQVLPDGGYYERSPMYHALMLEGILDVMNILGEDHEDRNFLKQYAERMLDFLSSVTHPDGNISLFNDATEEIAPPTEKLIEYGDKLLGYKPKTPTTFKDTGYYIYQDKDIYCIIDGGPVGPDHLPAHAHADIFSYELSINGTKAIVDSGVYEYQQGKMRQYVRSTQAHNTVCIDDKDQVECWDSFRVARRYKPYDVSYREEEGCRVFKGSYAGYSKLIGDGIVHHRIMSIDPDNKQIKVTDKIEGKNKHKVGSYIHIHPDFNIEPGTGEITVKSNKAQFRIIPHNTTNFRIEKGWYCPRFGVKLEKDVIVLGGFLQLPAEISYTIDYS